MLADEPAARVLAAQTPGAYVEVRPGASVRCADYCPVAQFCPQRQAELAREQEEAGFVPAVAIH